MEQNLPIVAKKFLKMVKVLYFMLRKGISKGKILADLQMMMKRGKIAGKAAIHSLMFHHHGDLQMMMKRGKIAGKAAIHSLMFHHHGGASGSATNRRLDYEFTMSSSRSFHIPFLLTKRKNSHQPTEAELMTAAMEVFDSAAASPALPGFGPSPLVRQLRITDSPFPMRDGEEDSHVDEAAEEFITRFYKDLRQQNSLNYLGYY